MDLQLAGKRAIVSGASAGIGRAIARQLAIEGVATAVCSRSLDRARAAIAQMGVTDGGRLLPVEVELRDVSSIKSMVQVVAEEFGGIDILVNSGADVAGNVAEDFAHVTDELVLRSFEDKFVGILRCCREVVPYMRAAGFGRIVNIAGSTARDAHAISAGARNAAVVNLTKALSIELGRDGITVNVVHPFTTVTERVHERMGRAAQRSGVTLDAHLAQIAERTSLGRLITAEEIAYFVTFLCSPLSVSLTGEVLALTGGLGEFVYS